MNIAVLSEGAWGTACATLFANNGHNVKLWCYNSDIFNQIKNTRFNQYLPSIKLDEKIVPTNNIEETLENVDWICQAIPTQFLRSILNKSKKYFTLEKPWVILSKGIENNTLFFACEIIQEVLEQKINFVIFSGPSFAIELAQKQITTVNLASQNMDLAISLQKIIDNNYFKSILIDDVIGIQICSAVKNIYSIALGMLSGLRHADNSRAFMITQALAETSIICLALGGKLKTVYDLAGVGDLVLTALSNKSRNFQFGQKIAQGIKLADLVNHFNSLPEGVNSLKAVYMIKEKYNLNLQLIDNIYKIIFETKPIDYIFNKLI